MRLRGVRGGVESCAVGGRPVAGSSSGRLEEEAPEEEKPDDEGERDDDELDERQSRYLRGFRTARALSRAVILSARRAACQRSILGRSGRLTISFPQKIRGKAAAGSVLRAHARRAAEGGGRAGGFVKKALDVIVCLTDSSPESSGALGEKLNREGQRVVRSRTAAGMVLLVLAAHAFVASATHFHTPFVAAGGSSQAALQSRDANDQGAPPSGEANCFLCRLQRDCAGGVRHSAPALAPPPAVSVEHESVGETAVRTARLLLRSGRAPPLA